MAEILDEKQITAIKSRMAVLKGREFERGEGGGGLYELWDDDIDAICCAHADMSALIDSHRALAKRIAEAERDKARLDWLGKFKYSGERGFDLEKYDGHVRLEGDHFREAIDLAMQQTADGSFEKLH